MVSNNSARAENNQHLLMRLPRTLSYLETWGFGLTGHVGWIGTAPIIHAALGSKAILVWFFGTIISFLLNLQVQSLGRHWSDVAGGTPNYITRLLKNFPGLGRYVALGYFFSWAAAPALYAIILTNLIKVNFETLGISCPETFLKVLFTAIPFILAFSGTRALALLHLFFVFPAILLLLLFCVQGVLWLAFSSASFTFLATSTHSLSFQEWAKWFFLASYSIYACETTSSFVADSRHPYKTLKFLTIAAWVIPPVFLGGSWVLMCSAPNPAIGDDTFLNLVAASKPFWGESAPFLVTLLITISCLLSSATAVSNSPRILYQLALDKQLSPIFALVSHQGVLGPAILVTFILSLLCLNLGNVSQLVTVAGTCYLMSIMGLHLGLWLCRGKPHVLWPWWSLGFFLVEAVVLIMGGLAWNWRDFLVGLLLPIILMSADVALRHLSFAPLHPRWWTQRYDSKSTRNNPDFVVLQVSVLVSLICTTATISWVIRDFLDRLSNNPQNSLLAILLVTLSFTGVAIACWTTLPQIIAIDEARKQARNLFITTLDTVPDTVLVLDEDGTISQTNAAAEELFQTSLQQLLGQNLSQLLICYRGKPEQWSIRSEQTLKINQGLRIVESTISQPFNSQLREYIVIVRDITKRKLAEEELVQHRYQLEKLVLERTIELIRVNQQLQQDIVKRQEAQDQLLHNSLHDGLTGLPNQRLFLERVQQAIEHSKQQNNYLFAVLFLDLDRFKVVNDSLGHLLGNQLLIAISHRLKSVLRGGDIVARFGGDEFTILIEEIEDIDTAIQVAERIKKVLALPFQLDEHRVFTNVSIGIALSRADYEQAAQILRDADVAMYCAKSLGKARYEVFDPKMHEGAALLLELETALRHALLKQEEFRLDYQPIVSLTTGKIIGFEALIRWYHPERGLISPQDFIPLAEETGMIVSIGQWVLYEACHQMHTWHKQFPTSTPLTISVNFSGKQITQPDVFKEVKHILQQTGLDPCCLKLEITETLLMDNFELATTVLSQLTALNVEMHMDDFGTGYSSLSYLHRLPIKTLKIDRSFVTSIGSRGENLEIIRAIVTLAHNLNMSVTAEGIETVEQLAQLKALQCDYGQGYFFLPPMERTEVEILLAANLCGKNFLMR
ncbi:MULTISPECIES: EAL domain-containing protein [unclassified Nostoc]|uniref:EAL domain-containing protein n=1 Tax=unclassified Nostoc TaxID=2593658 RepID=UPI002AD2386C|nr:EAL domain-containing protein [Nostoc sp. DedQUE03]MDZ7974749.1 EAL domain-containing protein [Nostoc sp. DedQUE03]MDZ8048062.1 EAL domain-containing protein [Nostoc sp. DedQUE02]